MKLRVWVSTDKVGSKCSRVITVPEFDEDLEELDVHERREVFSKYALEAVWNMVEWGYEEVPE